jgi:UvrD/REP helicase N-terminal domain
MELDDTRRDILAADGHLLIEGGPGSGKTTIALLKAARTLTTLEPEQRVVFLSFSRAAVRQILARVIEHIPRALRDHLEVRTFHAFFLDLVRAHGPLITGTPSAFLPPDTENTRKADWEGDWDAETENLASRGIYVFDRLAPAAATLLERSPALRRLYSDRYPLVIVDEFQDTNLDQWRAIQALAEGSTVICLADPDQRIYEGFIRGVEDKRLQQAIDALHPAASAWEATTIATPAAAFSTTPTPFCAATLPCFPRQSTTSATGTLTPPNSSPTGLYRSCRCSSPSSLADFPPSRSWPRPMRLRQPSPSTSLRNARPPAGARCLRSNLPGVCGACGSCPVGARRVADLT